MLVYVGLGWVSLDFGSRFGWQLLLLYIDVLIWFGLVFSSTSLEFGWNLNICHLPNVKDILLYYEYSFFWESIILFSIRIILGMKF